MNLPVEYSDKPVTPFGGLELMKRFVDQIKIREHLDTLDLPSKGSNRSYDSKDVVESFWLNIWAGASKYVHCNILRQDQVLKRIFGLSQIPSQSTYSRFFGKFSQARNTAVFPEIQSWFFKQINTGAITVDFDSTVITREGQQEGAAVGYNPNRRGRNSHHPLMAFTAETKMVVNAWLRPGNTAASSNCEAFFEETFNQSLNGQKVGLVRADSGFYTEKLLTDLETRKLNYIIATRAYPNVKHKIGGLTEWVEICNGISVCEFTHQFQQPGAKARRHFVVRKEVKKRPEAGGKQLFEELPCYRYSVYVTNLDLPISEIWNIYNGRADCENRIKELKQDFGLESFCLKDFWATEASFRLSLVAYNLMILFQHIALNQGKKKTLHTLRTLQSKCFAIGAWTRTHARKCLLMISLPKQRRRWMTKIRDQIPTINFPVTFSNA